MYILVSIIFHVTVKKIFQWSYCTFNKSRLSFTHSWLNLCPLSSTKLLKHSSKFGFLVNPNVFRSIPFCNHGWKGFRSFLRNFCSHSFSTYISIKQVLMNWWEVYTIILFCQFINVSKILSPNFISESSKSSHSLEFSCCQSKFFIKNLWM